jgi:hypothetical protein
MTKKSPQAGTQSSDIVIHSLSQSQWAGTIENNNIEEMPLLDLVSIDPDLVWTGPTTIAIEIMCSVQINMNLV